jgi:hypothetical protein
LSSFYVLINIKLPLDYNQIRIGAIEFESQKKIINIKFEKQIFTIEMVILKK